MTPQTVISLEWVADQEAIRTLKSQYCRFIDTKNWDAFSGLLTENPAIVFKGAEGAITHTFSARDAFVQSCHFLQLATTIHRVYNPEIDVLSATTARAIWAMEDQIFFPDDLESPFKTLHGYGHYHETYEKIEGQWKIKTLLLQRQKLDIH